VCGEIVYFGEVIPKQKQVLLILIICFIKVFHVESSLNHTKKSHLETSKTKKNNPIKKSIYHCQKKGKEKK